MKKLYTLSFVMLCAIVNANAVAVICESPGNCMEVTELNKGDGWKNACCIDIPYTGTCTDDCSLNGGGIK